MLMMTVIPQRSIASSSHVDHPIRNKKQKEVFQSTPAFQSTSFKEQTSSLPSFGAVGKPGDDMVR